jgi:hypothetical protein
MLPNEDPPAELFHYTTAPALHNILKTRELWATSVQYMNDASELVLAMELVVQALRHVATNSSSLLRSERLIGLADAFGSRLLSFDPDMFTPVTVCSLSLSADGDLLSQWRGYGGSLPAFAIGFNTEELQAVLARTPWTLRRVRYTEADRQPVLDYLVREASEIDVNLREQLWTQFLETAPVLKHEGFREEQEWRLISGKTPLNVLKYRPAPTIPIPYAVIELGSRLFEVISRVRIGPHPQQELARVAVAGYLESVLEVPKPVDVSVIPYRTL